MQFTFARGGGIEESNNSSLKNKYIRCILGFLFSTFFSLLPVVFHSLPNKSDMLYEYQYGLGGQQKRKKL